MFSINDFRQENNRLNLNAIIMDKLLLPPLTLFSTLEGQTLKRKYNAELQQYIKNLDENWDETITKDFNYIMGDYMSSSRFQRENIFVPTITTEK